MKSAGQQSAVIIGQLEAYLAKIAKALPGPKSNDLLKYLSPILSDISPRSKMLRIAFGFPSDVNTSRELTHLLLSSEPSLRPIIGVCAQRLHQFLWRFEYSLQVIDTNWKEETVDKLASISQLCEPYLISERPTLVEVSTALELKSDLKRFSESAADPTLFAALRAFDNTDRPLLVSDTEEKAIRTKVLTFICDFLIEIIDRKRRIDDSSNAWWALRVGLENGDPRFEPLLDRMLQRFPKVEVPNAEVKSLSVVPDIYIDLRTSAYTLSNIQAILESQHAVSAETRYRLQALIDATAQRLLRATRSDNLYLACVHYEGLRNYLDYKEHEYITSKIHSSHLSLKEFRPVGDFVCVDPSLESEIRDLLSWLYSPSTKGSRNAVLVYGASSTGKTFLIEQLFCEFGQKDDYLGRHIICNPGMDFIAELRKVLKNIAAKSPASHPPFLFIDEIDVEFTASIYPILLSLLDKGEVAGDLVSIPELVVFWVGGKHGSVQELKSFLDRNQKSKEFEKGFDLFNRTKRRVELPGALVRNKNQKLLLGLAAIVNRFGSPAKVDISVIDYLRSMPMADKQGARAFEALASMLQQQGGVIFVPGENRRGHEIVIDA